LALWRNGNALLLAVFVVVVAVVDDGFDVEEEGSEEDAVTVVDAVGEGVENSR